MYKFWLMTDTYNEVIIMKRKKVAVISIWAIALVALVGSIFFLQKSLSSIKVTDDGFDYVSGSEMQNDTETDVKVNAEAKAITRPYKDENIKTVKYFYDYQSEKTKQEQSIVYYEKTYIQNSGVDYSGEEAGIKNFEVISILDGTIVDVKEDELLGKVVEVKYGENLIASYQGLSEITVKKDDKVTQGTVIGKSGTAKIASDLKDHLHFELYDKGQVVDPEKYYDKTLEEL